MSASRARRRPSRSRGRRAPARALSKHESHDGGRLRAERHTDADLRGPQRDQVRHDAIDTSDGEDERQPSEHSQEEHAGASRRDGVSRHIVHALHVCNRQIRIHGVDLFTRGRCERGGGRRSAAQTSRSWSGTARAVDTFPGSRVGRAPRSGRHWPTPMTSRHSVFPPSCSRFPIGEVPGQ